MIEDASFFIAMAFYTYILFSDSLNRFYYGQCNDLENRLERHNRGYVRSTRHGRPWKLAAYKQCRTRSESMKLEKQLKNLHSSEKLKRFIARHNFEILLWKCFKLIKKRKIIKLPYGYGCLSKYLLSLCLSFSKRMIL